MDVEWLILADSAEAINNKLYLIGGGWESLTVNASLPYLQSFAVAIAFKVPWSEADRWHNVTVAILDPSGVELADVAGRIEVGRPAGVPLGNAQRVLMAIQIAMPLQHLGNHDVIVRIEGQEARRATFHVVAGPESMPRYSV